MPRLSKQDELSTILGPLTMDILAALTELGVVLSMEQTIALMQRIQKKSQELTSGNNGGPGNGYAT